jgi:hypothetical protein
MDGRKIALLAMTVVVIGISAVGLGAQVASNEQGLQIKGTLSPAGVELSDAELLGVEGELAPLALLSWGLIGGVTTAGANLCVQLYDGGDVDWGLVGVYFGAGFVTGTAKLAEPLVRASLVSAMRWSAIAGAAISRGAAYVGQQTAAAMGVAQTALHNYVRVPLSNALGSAWQRLTGK